MFLRRKRGDATRALRSNPAAKRWGRKRVWGLRCERECTARRAGDATEWRKMRCNACLGRRPVQESRGEARQYKNEKKRKKQKRELELLELGVAFYEFFGTATG